MWTFVQILYYWLSGIIIIDLQFLKENYKSIYDYNPCMDLFEIKKIYDYD